MPTKQLENYAKRAGVSVKEAEKKWEEAKEKANKRFPESERDSDSYWSYVNVTCMLLLGIRSPKKKSR